MDTAKNNYKTGWFKFILGWLTCFFIRLLPFRPPNVEPILATIMPFSKKYRVAGSFLFGFFSIAFIDLAEHKAGSWTLVTGLTYGLVGVGAYYFFRQRASNRTNYVIYSIIGTLIYDAITGLAMGPVLYGQPFIVALLGQIPFTVIHLLGNITFALVISPVLFRWVIENKNLETGVIWSKLYKAAI